ncbi:MAG: hypothetical protein COB78_08295 [Hyphomicrobiales bacterium]|nr:MAG: hypothetical protein COB78_08295 [Hyphomicrobiales bacterium]
MKTLLVTFVASLAFVGAAFAGEVEGKVQSVDATKIVLENGTALAIGEGVSVDGVQAGAEVKIVYDDSTKMVTEIHSM